jgi:glutathione synthase
MAEETNLYYNSSPLLADPANYPINNSLVEIAAGLADGWRAYGKNEAVVLFVVQENERNVFDQRLLQYELLEKYVQIISHPRHRVHG